MEGYKLFVGKLDELTINERNKIIKQIFGFEKVIFYFLIEEEGNIIFRIYDGKRYIKIRIVFLDQGTQNFFEFRLTDVSLICDVFIKNFVDDDSNFSKFVKILLEGNISYFDSFL